jgi:hypothetical protein
MTHADEMKLDPSIGISYGYDDNILFQKNNEIHDSYVGVRPKLSLTRRTEASTINSMVRYDAYRYIDEDDFDYDRLRFELNSNFENNERWSTKINLLYNKDTTLDTYLDETGRIITRDDHQLYKISGNLNYLVTDISSVAIGYRYIKSDFDDQSFDDSESHRGYLSFFHRLKNQIDMLFVQPAYYYSRSEFQEVEDLSLSLGWRRSLTETLISKAEIGVRHTTIEKAIGTEDDTWGVKALFELSLKNAVNNTTIQYFHDLRTTASGMEITTDNLLLKHNRSITQRFWIGAALRAVFSDRVTSQEEIANTFYFQVQPHLNYLLTENSSLRLTYQYHYNRDDALDTDKVVDRNRVWIEFRMGWPITM